ncbi:hypothetical protein BLA17378_01380 [Burkholderia aenigmatica]|uniref:Uncharacterized protein n=1 Tax=Burkholderia aenigmatica TaxID=2015348 RepID=A0ABY6XLK5_9BURK|nr:hypothetical protein BLA17378_01380 [Burkholderia aenigmatica]VWC67196.1 hypothetical protein BLA18628_00242 [Burkholderia aenigmatica]
MKRCIAQVTYNVHIGASINQHPHIVNGTLARGKMQESIVHRSSLIWVGQFKAQKFRVGLVLLKNRFQLLF